MKLRNRRKPMPRKRTCVMGSMESVENNVSWKTFIPCVGGNIGLVCNGCNRFTCEDCVARLLSSVENQTSSISIKKNEVIKSYRMYLRTGMNPKVCHACWVISQRDVWSKNHKLYVESCREPMDNDGVLVFPEFCFAVDSPLVERRVVDVHVWGKRRVHIYLECSILYCM